MQKIEAKAIRILCAAAQFAVLLPAAVAWAEPIVIINSYHNLDYAREACDFQERVSQKLMPEDPDVLNGIAECKLAGDGRNLGRRLENAVIDQLAINTRCPGVSIFRQNHPDYDGKNNFFELAEQEKQFHWDLFLDYNPGQKTHAWALFPKNGPQSDAKMISGVLEGQGTAVEIADQICIVVTKRGANIVR
jgi:hypothetical protein